MTFLQQQQLYQHFDAQRHLQSPLASQTTVQPEAGRTTTLTLQDALFNIVIAQLNQLTSVSKAVLRVADKCRRE